MKAAAPIVLTFALLVILALLTASIFLNLVKGEEKIQGGGYIPPKEIVECKINSDCSTNINGQICMSINEGKSFCGCLDEMDCGGRNCIYNRCIS